MENNRYREEEKEMDVAPETEIVEETKEVESDMSEENKKNKKHKKNHLYEENQALKKENAELKDQLLRNLAELENFKKRTNEERIKDRKYALADFLISRSTKGPKTAADKPKNKIAIENAHSTLGTDCPMLSAIACLKTLQAYTVPILP